ncbi:Putative signal transducing protein [Flavobacterium glycines]|uniref:Signal transducing protein n=1 Tax=Flavobacterium glycines TaxID=551990 RepID=A0A1B9DN08_9FLAO|nr:DUF2007 domain-containing protein [Flavobacterium glycines]OCB71077.1 hypothetical protein FBGL_11555 [Flavobacterium glycines]GEL10893.1 hypothetical protein FGL01_16320 [Flavobacterium glycines]SDI49862.1 Putative signal transducing protein [Flavobacterium glycines]
MVVVFSGSYFEAMNVKNLLEGREISVFSQNEYMSNIEPWVVASGGLNPVKLQVDESDLEVSKEIIEDYLNGINNLETEDK